MRPFKALALAALIPLLAGAAAPRRVVRVGYQPTSVVYLVAKEKGWFEQEFARDSVTIQHDRFPVGPPIIESFAGGRSDIGFMADQPPIQARANHIDIKAIALTSTSEKAYGILARKGSGIRTIRDLKGRKVGTSVGSVLHQLLLLFLKSEGLTLGDIKLVNLAPADLNVALQGGAIDAEVNCDPFNAMALAAGTAVLVKDGTGFKEVVNLIVARNAFLQANPDLAVRFLKVYARADAWVADHPAEAARIVARVNGYPADLLQSLLSRLKRGLVFRPEAVRSVADTAAFLHQEHIIRTPVDVKDLFDPRYLEQAGIRR